MARSLRVALLAIALSACPVGAAAQLPRDAPSERPYEPELSPPAPAPELRPELPSEPAASVPGPASGHSVWVDALVLRGNRAIEDERLEAGALRFLGRRLGPQQLQQLAEALTQVYVDAGYVNSGAFLPDQAVREGRLAVEIVEGSLESVQVAGVRSYHAEVLEARLSHAIPMPLRIQEVERALRLLERDRRIRRLDARLRPGGQRGRARLEVTVEEAYPIRAGLGVDNYESETVGTVAGRVSLAHDNPLGRGDGFWSEGAFTEGLRQGVLAYELPVHPSGTALGVEGRISRAEVVSSPFDEIDIESEVYSVSGLVKQPLLRGLSQELWLSLRFDERWGRTSLLGRGFSFEPGAEDGRVRLSVLRPTLEWSWRERDFGVALRSVFSIGLGFPGVTRASSDVPDARFFAWLGQLRGIYRHPGTGAELHLRFDVQQSDDPLLSLEQFALGGPGSVRGYPRSLLVRDQGLAGSVELRWPLWRGVALAGFFDAGRAWNRGRPTPGPKSLSSLGLGLHVQPLPRMVLVAEWGWPLRDVDVGSSLQADGLLLALRWSFP